MTLTQQEKNLIHHVGETVLDQQHLSFELLQYDTDSAIRSLVQCYDQAMCEAIRLGESCEHVSNIGNAGMRGLPRAIQWFQSRDSKPASKIELSGKPARHTASELLKWSIQYDKLYCQHVALGKGMVDATIDESQRIIEFRYSFQVDPKYFVSQQEAMAHADKRRRDAFPDVAPLAASWTDSINGHSEGWSADDSLLLRSGAIDKVELWLNSFCLPELGSAQSFGQFSVGELRRFLAALYAYSHCHTKIQNGTDLPITIVEMAHAGFIHWLSTLTGLSQDVISYVAEIFQYHIEPPHITLGQKPLIRTSSSILFSPYIINALAPEQLVIGALNACRRTRTAYSSAINTIETEGVKAIEQQLNKLLPNSQIIRQPELNFSDGPMYTPDIILYQPLTNQIFVLDIKYACQPFSTGDVYSDTEEFQGWKTKMLEYVQHIQCEPEQVLRLTNLPATLQPTVLGLICPRWPLVVPVDFTYPLAAVDYGSLISHLEVISEAPLADLNSWAASRPDVQAASSVREITKVIKAGDWSYHFTVLAPEETPSRYD